MSYEQGTPVQARPPLRCKKSSARRTMRRAAHILQDVQGAVLALVVRQYNTSLSSKRRVAASGMRREWRVLRLCRVQVM